MTENQEQAREAYYAYIDEILRKPPYDKYVTQVGMESLFRMRRVHEKAFVLPAGESIDNLCLSVFVREVPSDDVRLPREYKGVRVFYTLAQPEKKLPSRP